MKPKAQNGKSNKGGASNKKRGNNKKRFTNRERAVESVDMKKDLSPAELREIEDNYHKGTPNDWRWYAQTPQLVKDNASFPFGDPLGLPIQWNSPVAQLKNIAVPGVMVYTFVPCIGYADSENSPINVASRRLYSFVVHANSRNPSYDAADLMLYYVCVDSALMFLETLKRLYGVMLDYTIYNRYYPKALVSAMGFSFGNIEEHLNDLRGYINQYAVKLNQLWIPNSLSYSARHAWMVSGLYVDSTAEKAQTVMYAAQAYYQFTLDSEGKGSAKLQNFYGNKGYEDIVAFGNGLLNAMIPNQDFGIMSGDILKAFGAASIVSITGIGESYQVLPVYNKEVLMQMENATIFDNGLVLGSENGVYADITQNANVGAGYLISKPRVPVGVKSPFIIQENNRLNAVLGASAPYFSDQLINMHGQEYTTPEMVMVATRLTNILSQDYVAPWTTQSYTNPTSYTYSFSAYVPTAGSELITGAFIYVYSNAGVLERIRVAKVPMGVLAGTSDQQASGINSVLSSVAAASQFDWHFGLYPKLTLGTEEGTVSSTTDLPIQDLDLYTTLSVANLKQMAQTALLSEFSVPQI